ncbi:hypothetical protein ERX46_04785 [Brumimicrobium glaciale]|jgi:hypothetical protein|uniref:Phage holin family protein n=1 Tax=Brumimicrobium glaciale TaxID=200475 RepID=A0A4Q4KMP7_9FLAO|nr:hypothetical protein [Brumimicrobium glaciale]RYM34693.1 hypothetical protein ERX46_04785 [Brumimicrobium glaciale]
MRENKTTEEGIDEVKRLLKSTLTLLKIKGIKKITGVLANATYGFLKIILIMTGLSFFGFALAIYLGGLLESYTLGFLIVGALPFLAIILMRIFNKYTLRYLLNGFTRIMTKKL